MTPQPELVTDSSRFAQRAPSSGNVVGGIVTAAVVALVLLSLTVNAVLIFSWRAEHRAVVDSLRSDIVEAKDEAKLLQLKLERLQRDFDEMRGRLSREEK